MKKLTLAFALLLSACSGKPTLRSQVMDRAPASFGGSYDNREIQSLVEQGLNRALGHMPNELIVQFRAGSTDADKGRAYGRINGNRAEVLVRGHSGKDLELIKFKKNSGVADAIRDVLADAAVDFAEPNWIVQHTAVSNDTYYTNGSLWGMYGAASTPSNSFGTRAAQTWTRGADCSNVVVGIIDQGYMYTHPDLAANAYRNPGEVPGNGIDDDGNGYVDDVYGWDFDGKDNTVFDGVSDDHGTHVAGTIGAVGGNGTGVAGMCWSVKILSAKFLGKKGGTTANAIKAVDYFTDLKQRHNLNLVATNNSWGGGGFSQGLADAIERAQQADILFIAAAGNDGRNNDSVTSYPSNYPQDNVIAVAALTSKGVLASFSNYGVQQVDLAAPGAEIWSTIPKAVQGKVTASYASYSGTSMATPHVTGAAALYKSRYPNATAAQIKAALLDGLSTPALQGKVATGDRLNVESF